MPVFVFVYQTMLTFLDPLAIVLLLARPRLCVMLTVVNITGKVVLNAWGRALAFPLDAFEPQNWHTPVHGGRVSRPLQVSSTEPEISHPFLVSRQNGRLFFG